MKNRPKIRLMSVAVIIIFLILCIIGISLDEPSQVLNQATRICLSCIGIG
ncbi:MAG: hypothetical protein MI863_27090 [Desulfobacterales bacterium]|nr:hypothetical protein [Desulfobacterales bacterium]